MRGAQPACQEYVIGRASYAAIGIAAGAGALATIIVLYPGQYPFDAAAQLWQARTGDFGNGSPDGITRVNSPVSKSAFGIARLRR